MKAIKSNSSTVVCKEIPFKYFLISRYYRSDSTGITALIKDAGSVSSEATAIAALISDGLRVSEPQIPKTR
jgi:hypothetical protein